MKVEVVEKFRDAKTGQMRLVGEVMEVDDKRAKVMVAARLVKSLEKPKATDEK